ncbi:UDP-N-acetylmuramoyl-L-alanyl-D-glutamate--2,6-diaminopimelate ligase [Tepidimonas ignava]|uniref:UDP-N-acetylmuramoyl-L-alanyl-D-glutamate--2, 6-diaminopimelate ligase n=1 Tax=Tepidimonas ignava TaxID=114249 RepID=UPI002FDA2A5F
MSAPVQRLDDLDAALAWLRGHGAQGLCADSRRLQPGDAFLAWPGAATDARAYVAAALAGGARAALVDTEGLDAWWQAQPTAPWPAQAPVAALAGLRALAGPLASAWWQHPSQRLALLAITGTNGKTSTAWWCAQWAAAAGVEAGLIGTLGVGRPGQGLQPTGLTTPDPVTLQGALQRFAAEGVSLVALEASSIGVEEGRLDGSHVHTAIFTNLTQDHLDYHGTMEAYWQAKRRLFDWPGVRVAVVCVDDSYGQRLAAELAPRVQAGALDLWTYGLDLTHAPRLAAHEVQWTPQGMRFTVVEHGQPAATLALPVVGAHNVANLLAVGAALRAQGVTWQALAAAAPRLTAVPGRMQPAWPDAPTDSALPQVVIDYAHTPDAVEKALQALRPLAQARGGRLWCVLGCGGDRDPSKRPRMAAAAEAWADRVVFTSDNPRSEDPHQIIAQMVQGLINPARAVLEPDRAAAIARTVQQADAHDVVLLAGKGHEQYQDIAGVRHPFCDVQQARSALQRRWEEQA